MKMLILLFLCIFAISHGKAEMPMDSTKAEENLRPFVLYLSIAKNTFKNKIGLSGLGIRISFIGFGMEMTQGVNALDYKPDFSEKSPKEGYTVDNLQGIYGYLKFYHDIKPLFMSLNLTGGYGSFNGSQYVSVGYIDSYPYEPEYKSGFVYGAGVNFHPYEQLVIGVSYNSINKFGVNIGVGLCSNLKDPITKYFRSGN